MFEVLIMILLSLAYINWTVDPLLFEVGPLSFQWYGVLFVGGILLGNQLMKWIYQRENIPLVFLEKLVYLVIGGTILGARLGHVFFYDWPYYSQHLLEIPMIWKGGLASHGAVLGIILSVWIYCKYILKRPLFWVGDRIVLPVCIGSACIRLGNLMNHEIIGDPTNVPWAFIFHLVDENPRHPAQLYEAISFIFILGVLFSLYLKTEIKEKTGALTGIFFILAFTFRFFIEFIKNSQGGFETHLGNIISTGQWLSIPFIIFGLILVFRAQFNNRKMPI